MTSADGAGGLPVSFLVSPVSQPWRGKPVKVKIIDNGLVPLRITAEPVMLHGRCVARPDARVTVTPASFALSPHQLAVTTVTVPEGVRADFGILYVAEPTGHHTGGLLAGAIGSQVLSGGASSCVPPRAAPVHHPAGFPVLPVALAAVAVLGILAGLAWSLRRRTRTT